MARPAHDSVTLWGVSRILGATGDALEKVINRPDFPPQTKPGHWQRSTVEAWADTPRCTYGYGSSKCWEERDPADSYQLGMCPEHTRLAHNIMRQHRVARLTHA